MPTATRMARPMPRLLQRRRVSAGQNRTMSHPAQTRSPNDRPAMLRGGVAVMLRSMLVGQLVIAAVLVCIGAVRAVAGGTPPVLAVAARG